MIRVVRYTPTEDNPKPARSATRNGNSIIWKVFNPADELHPDAEILANPHAAINEIPKKNDLPPSHPLYDRRLVEPVLAGMHDIEMKTDGSFVEIVDGVERPYSGDPE